MRVDLVVLGGGPGGYSAALRASQLGMKVALVERKRVGGVCLNEGCIPTKALLHSAHAARLLREGKKLGIEVEGEARINWERVQEHVKGAVEKLVGGVEYLLQKSGVEVITGEGKLRGDGKIEVAGEVIDSRWVILATGSRPAELKTLPFGGRVLTSSQLMFAEKPPQSLIVIGAGAIGLELATAFSSFGAEVKVVEALATPLGGMDRDMAALLIRALKEKGIQIFTSSFVEEGEQGKEGIRLWLRDGRELEGELALVAVGRKPNSEIFQGLLELDERGFVRTFGDFRTSMEGVFAIGDLAGPPLLAHKAHHQGVALVEKLGGLSTGQLGPIPMAVFTEPEFALVGLSEEQAKKSGIKYKKAKFPMGANGRAVGIGQETGAVKILADEDGRLLGVQILGPGASEIIAEASLAMREGLKARQLAEAVHVHPTVSEALMEAAMALEKKAIHIINR